MGKKLKIALIIFGVVVLCAASYILYILKFKDYDIADESVDEIIEESYEIELPDGTIITLNEDGDVVEEEIGEKKAGTTVSGNDNQGSSEGATSKDSQDSSEGSTSKDEQKTITTGGTKTDSSTSSSTGKTTPQTGSANTSKPGSAPSTPGTEAAKPSVATIKEKYTPAFQALEGQADDKLNALIGRAKNEYLSKKENGEKVDYGYFYNKYTSAAAELEGRTDNVFAGVLKAVERDLEKNGFDKSYAKSFSEQYNAQKKSRKDSLMKRAMGQ
ncbi:hypothetical protein M3193_08125 [Sporosarcina luteola]|uniref:hypothetical protein n=1 Tax=Sporosarcina luteola TaxID=582850 RepID=UPI00203E2466|nr:hypothetical protein [Sporosarcina luteola]MCM3744108.1 hypothetical protein [Sporosarcina luteola]